jgi:hypothetical protein
MKKVKKRFLCLKKTTRCFFGKIVPEALAEGSLQAALRDEPPESALRLAACRWCSCATCTRPKARSGDKVDKLEFHLLQNVIKNFNKKKHENG